MDEHIQDELSEGSFGHGVFKHQVEAISGDRVVKVMLCQHRIDDFVAKRWREVLIAEDPEFAKMIPWYFVIIIFATAKRSSIHEVDVGLKVRRFLIR